MVFEDGCSLGKSWEQGGSSGKDGGSGGGYIHSYRYLRVCLSKVCFFFYRDRFVRVGFASLVFAESW